MYELADKILPTNWLPNANAKHLTIQNLYVSTEISCSSDNGRKYDLSFHKDNKGEDQNNEIQHGQLGDNVGT